MGCWQEEEFGEVVWQVLTHSQGLQSCTNQGIVNHPKGIKDFFLLFYFLGSTRWESRGWKPSSAPQERGKKSILIYQEPEKSFGGIEAI